MPSFAYLSCLFPLAAAVFLATAAPLPAQWSDPVLVGGPGAVGSPGGSHPLAVDGDTVHFAWAQGGDLYCRRSTNRGADWSHAVRLTTSGTAQYPCSLEPAGSALHLIWPDSRNGSWELFYKRSTDGGKTWGPDKRLTPGVDLFRLGTAVSGSALHVVWGSRSLVRPTPAGTHTWGEIYYKRSTDGGETWEPDVQLTQPRATAMRPAIAVAGTNVYVTWFDRRDSKGELDWQIYAKRSTDGGKTWGADVRMTDTAKFAHHPQIVATSGGRVCCLWEDGQTFDGKTWGGDPALYAAVSADGGQTWKPARRITSVNAPRGWATHSKSYACGARIHLAWTDAPEGLAKPRAAYYMTSADGGLTWGPAERLTAADDGESWAAAVAGTESYAIAVVSRADMLLYRKRDLAQSPADRPAAPDPGAAASPGGK